MKRMTKGARRYLIQITEEAVAHERARRYAGIFWNCPTWIDPSLPPGTMRVGDRVIVNYSVNWEPIPTTALDGQFASLEQLDRSARWQSLEGVTSPLRVTSPPVDPLASPLKSTK